MNKQSSAVLLMAFGTPLSDDQLLPYYTDIRHGHAPSAAQVAALAARYRAIGGLSPLAKITDQQVATVKNELTSRGIDVPVILGLSHTAPHIEEAVDRLAATGVDVIYGVPLAAQYSSFNARSYHDKAKAALEKHPELHYVPVNDQGGSAALIDYWANQLNKVKELISAPETAVLFSAHSLPVRTREAGDPYKLNVEADVRAAAQLAYLSQYWLGWQSAGKTGSKWIGPRFEDVAQQLIDDGAKHIVSVPLGFINDNLEINYDVDIELRRIIEQAGAQLTRLPMPNADPAVATTICDRLEAAGLTNQ